MNPKPNISPDQKLALTVTEFCALHGISDVARYYRLRRDGLGPVEIRIGRTIRISREAAAAWRRARENPKGDEASSRRPTAYVTGARTVFGARS